MGESLANDRTQVAFQSRWKTLSKNPKLVVIALFASYVMSTTIPAPANTQKLWRIRVWVPAGRLGSIPCHVSVQRQFPLRCRILERHWLAYFDPTTGGHPRIPISRSLRRGFLSEVYHVLSLLLGNLG